MGFDLLGNKMSLNSSILNLAIKMFEKFNLRKKLIPEKKSRGKVAKQPDGRILFHLLSFHLCRLSEKLKLKC